jgi:hypothetical protein
MLLPKKSKRRLLQSIEDVEEEIERVKIARLLGEAPGTVLKTFEACRFHDLPMEPFIPLAQTDTLAKKRTRLAATLKRMYEETPPNPNKIKTQRECYCGSKCLAP